ncbi:Flp pilus assembly CpaF family ATPase [Bradyrhizobium diazoefficiens]
MREVIGEAVNLIVSIERTDRGRQVRDVLHVESFSAGQYRTQSYAPKEERHVA